MSLSTPLKLKGTQGDLQQLNSTEENYLAYLAGTQLAASAGSDPGDLTLVVDGHNIVGTFVDTYFNEAVGTHPASAITSGSTSTTVYQRNGTAAESGSDFRRPVAYNDGQIVEMNDTQFNSLVDRLNGRIASSDYVGVFKLGSSSPGADYTVYSTGVFSDTDTVGTVTTYNLYRRTSMTAPSSVKIMSIKRSGGATGDYQGVQEMTDAQAQYSLGQRAKTRRAIDSNIGSYKLRTSSQGAPSTGTWRAVGTATNTKKTTSEISYSRNRTSAYLSSTLGNFVRNSTSVFVANYLGDYLREYTGNFIGNYINDYTGNYTADFTGDYSRTATRTRITNDTSSTFLANYTGNFVRNRPSTFFREDTTSTFVADFIGNYIRERNESRAGAYTANYAGNYAGEFVGNYTGDYVGDYVRQFEENVTRSYTGDYIGDYIREYFRDVGYNREYYRSDSYNREYYRSAVGSTGTFSRTTSSTTDSAYTFSLIPATYMQTSFSGTSGTVYWNGVSMSPLGTVGRTYSTFTGSDGQTYILAIASSPSFSDSKLNTASYAVSRRTTTTTTSNYFRNYFREVLVDTETYSREVLVDTQTYFRNQFARDVNVTKERRATRSYTGDYIFDVNVEKRRITAYSRLRTRTRTRDRTANFFRNFVRTFEGDIAKNYTRNTPSTFIGDRVVSYQGSATRVRTAVTPSTFTGDFAGNFVGNYIRERASQTLDNREEDILKDRATDFSRNIIKDRTANFTGDYIGDYTRTYTGDYSRTFTGNYTGTTIQASRETIETYTLYVRTA